MSKEKIHHHLHAHVHEKITVLSLALLAALSLNLVTRESFALAQEQAVPESSNITAPVVQPDTSQPIQAPQPQEQPAVSSPSQCPPGEEPGVNDQGQQSCIRRGNGNMEEDGGPQEIVDPREIQETLRQIKQLQFEVRNLTRQLVRVILANKAEVKSKLEDLTNKLGGFAQSIKNPPADLGQRGALQEFYDARLWEEMEGLRTVIQLPKELKDISRTIAKIERMLKMKTFQKLGLDMARINQLFETIKISYRAANDAFNAGDLEGAREAMQTFWEEGMHPGGLEGALHRIRGIKDMLRMVRDKQIIAAIEELLAPVYEALYEGDFQEFHAVMGEYEDDLRRLMNLIVKKRLRYDKAESKLLELEDLISNKFGDLEQRKNQQNPQESNPSPAPLPAPTR